LGLQTIGTGFFMPLSGLGGQLFAHGFLRRYLGWAANYLLCCFPGKLQKCHSRKYLQEKSVKKVRIEFYEKDKTSSWRK